MGNGGSDDARRALTVFMGLLAIYLLTANWHGPSSWTDTFAASVGARQISQHGIPILESVEAVEATPWVVESTAREHVVARLPGAMYLAAPVYLLLDLEVFRVAPATAVAVVSTAAGAVLLGFSLRRSHGIRAAMVAALTIGLATPAWGIGSQALWTHGPTLLWLGLAAMAMSRDRLGWAGVALGGAVFTRPDLAVVPFCAALYLAWSRRSLEPLVKLSTSLWGAMAYLGYGRIVFGSWSLTGAYDSFMEGRIERLTPTTYGWRIAGTLVSPSRGVLMHTPVVMAALAPAAWRQAPDWLRGLTLGGGVYVVGGRLLEGFAGGAAQDTYRYALEAVVLLLLVAVPWLLEAGRAWVVALLVGFSVSVQAVAALFDGPYPEDVAAPGFGVGDWAYVPGDVWAAAGAIGLLAAGLLISTWSRLTVTPQAPGDGRPVEVGRHEEHTNSAL